MRETYFLLNYEIQQGNTELLPEVMPPVTIMSFKNLAKLVGAILSTSGFLHMSKVPVSALIF